MQWRVSALISAWYSRLNYLTHRSWTTVPLDYRLLTCFDYFVICHLLNNEILWDKKAKRQAILWKMNTLMQQHQRRNRTAFHVFVGRPSCVRAWKRRGRRGREIRLTFIYWGSHRGLQQRQGHQQHTVIYHAADRSSLQPLQYEPADGMSRKKWQTWERIHNNFSEK